jgi:hypothetical protein
MTTIRSISILMVQILTMRLSMLQMNPYNTSYVVLVISQSS